MCPFLLLGSALSLVTAVRMCISLQQLIGLLENYYWPYTQKIMLSTLGILTLNSSQQNVDLGKYLATCALTVAPLVWGGLMCRSLQLLWVYEFNSHTMSEDIISQHFSPYFPLLPFLLFSSVPIALVVVAWGTIKKMMTIIKLQG